MNRLPKPIRAIVERLRRDSPYPGTVRIAYHPKGIPSSNGRKTRATLHTDRSWTIDVGRNLTPTELEDAMIHEWAHVKHGCEDASCSHDADWGRTYAGVYRDLHPGLAAPKARAVQQNVARNTFTYWAACPDLNGPLIHFITDDDRAKKITYKTFAHNVDLSTLPGGREHPALYRISRPDNWAISFWKSTLPSGQPIYYFDWSRIEHIFVDTPVDLADEMQRIDAGSQDRKNRLDWARDYPENRLPAVLDMFPSDYRRQIPVGAGQREITIYRAVPPEVRSIRPGDWVALERGYAADMGRGRVLKMTVPVADVAWAGTDHNEWFYVPQANTMTNPTQMPLLEKMVGTSGAQQRDPALVVRSPADGMRALEHPAVVKQWRKSLKWEPKNRKAVLIPCSSVKPYYQSASHKHGYLPAIKDKDVDTFVVSEPMAVIPYAWVDEYPNMAYEFAPKHVKGKTRKLLVERIRGWLEKVGTQYDTLYLALPEHHRKMVMDAAGQMELPTVDLSISVCRAEGACDSKTFRATSKGYRSWLGRKIRQNPDGESGPSELKRKLLR